MSNENNPNTPDEVCYGNECIPHPYAPGDIILDDDDPPLEPLEGLRRIPAAEFPSSAHSRLTSALIHKVHHGPEGPHRNYHIRFDKTLASEVRRPDPLYPTPYETMRAQYYDGAEARDNTSDHQLIVDLIKGQPYRIPTALAPAGQLPCETLGPLMLPESADPLATAPNAPVLLPRPKPWSPEATNKEITLSICRELLDVTSVYAARLKTATGHLPDSEGIAQTLNLSVVMKNLQKILRTEERDLQPKIKRTRRPRRQYIAVPAKLTLLSQETHERKKLIHTPEKYRVSSVKSALELPAKEKVEISRKVNQIKAAT